MAAAPARVFLPKPESTSQPARPPRTSRPAGPPRTRRTRAAVSRRLGPAVRLGTRPEASHVRAGGQPLAPGTRSALEDSFQADLGEVRVHSDSQAQAAAGDLSARAFTHGNNIALGPGESATDLPLMAHETAHVLQQQGQPAIIQHFTPNGGDAYEREAHQASQAVVRGDTFRIQQRTQPQVQRWGVKDALDKFAELANAIPGFRMLTIVLGVNPINMSAVARTPANVLRALVELIPLGGLISQALDNYGIFDKIGSWVDQQISSLGLTASALKSALTEFIDSLHWSDIFDLGGVWDRAKRIFTAPIQQIIDFANGLVDGIVNFIKDAILKPLAKLAEGTDGWNLLIAVLGKNPITGESVPRNADTLIGPIMNMIGQGEVWQNIKKARAGPRAWAWFKNAMSGLLGFVEQIPDLFISTLKSLEIMDIVLLPRAFGKVATVFGGFLGDFAKWAGNAVWDLLKIIFEVLAPGAIPYLQKVGAAFKKILNDPMSFVGNLVNAGKLGFQNFANNILTHLKAGIIDWLTGSLTGVYIPRALEFREILKFVLSVLGLTWQNIRPKIVKVVGEPAMKAMETGFDLVVTLVTQGPAAAWQKIKEQLGNLKDMVMQGIMDFIKDTVVKKAVAKITSLMIPGAGFIQAIVTIYDTIMVFVSKLQKIIQVAMAFLDSIMAIANGAIGGAAAKVESTLAGLLTLAINFLAGFAGAGKVADKVMGIVNTRVRAPVDKAVDGVIAWIVAMAKKAGKALMKAIKGEDKRTPEEKQRDLDIAVRDLRPLLEKLLKRGVPRLLLMARLAVWRVRYKLTSLTAEKGVIRATINPTADMYTVEEIAIGAALEPILQAAEVRFLKQQASLPQSKKRLHSAQAALERGRTIPRSLTGPEKNIIIRRAAAGKIVVPNTDTGAQLLNEQGGDPYTLRLTWSEKHDALRLLVKHSDFPFRFDFGKTQLAYHYGFGDADENRDPDAHLPGQPFPYPRRKGDRGGDINLWLATHPGKIHPAIEGLSHEIETARFPGNWAADQVGQTLIGAGVPLAAQKDPRKGGVLLTPAEGVHGLFAGMAVPSSWEATKTRVDTGSAPTNPSQLHAEEVRHGSYGVIFQTLRQAIQTNAKAVLVQPGGPALQEVAKAFKNWLDVAMPRQLKPDDDDQAVKRAAQELQNKLVAFFRARNSGG